LALPCLANGCSVRAIPGNTPILGLLAVLEIARPKLQRRRKRKRQSPRRLKRPTSPALKRAKLKRSKLSGPKTSIAEGRIVAVAD
jgi:hypothetical protein